MFVCQLSVLCVVRYRSLSRSDPSSRGVISSVVCVCVCVIAQPQRCEGLGPLGLSSHWGVEAKIQFYVDHLYSIHSIHVHGRIRTQNLNK